MPNDCVEGFTTVIGTQELSVGLLPTREATSSVPGMEVKGWLGTKYEMPLSSTVEPVEVTDAGPAITKQKERASATRADTDMVTVER